MTNKAKRWYLASIIIIANKFHSNFKSLLHFDIMGYAKR